MSANVDEIWYSWGMIRRRGGFEVEPMARREVLTVILVPALLIELAWMALLAVLPSRWVVAGVLGLPSATLWIPLGVAGAFLVAGILLPMSIVEQTSLPGWVVLSRERGWLGRWDLPLAGMALIGLCLGALRIPGLIHWPVVVIVCGLSILIALGLVSFKPAPLLKRTWMVNVPPWLLTEEEKRKRLEPRRKENDKPPGPEEGASPVFPFEPIMGSTTRRGVRPQVGIKIATEVVAELRGLNQAANGRLYQTNPRSVVLGDVAPTNDKGVGEMNRLCLQITDTARYFKLTRYQLASSILWFVQKVIRYEYDGPSTQRILGSCFEEYGRFPLETLADEVGDCDCTTLLCAALLSRCGFGCALIHVEVSPGEGHLAVGLAMDGDLFLGETPIFDEPNSIITYQGINYLYGETAVDPGESAGAPRPDLGFGVVPLEWRGTLRVEKVMPIPLP